jgi:hypothetical protein
LCGHLVYFLPFWYVVPRKIWQPWTSIASFFLCFCFLTPSAFLSLSLSLSLYLSLSIHLFVSPSLSLSISISIYPSICQPFSLSLSLSLSLSIYLSIPLSLSFSFFCVSLFLQFIVSLSQPLMIYKLSNWPEPLELLIWENLQRKRLTSFLKMREPEIASEAFFISKRAGEKNTNSPFCSKL